MEDVKQYLEPTEFFDFHKKRVRDKALEITEGLKTDKEKAIVDSLFLTGYVTLDETVACLRSKIEYKKAMDYARRIDRQSVIKRLGYLLSTVGIQCPSEYSSGLSKTYVPLDPSLPKRGKYDPKWRIIINRVIE